MSPVPVAGPVSACFSCPVATMVVEYSGAILILAALCLRGRVCGLHRIRDPCVVYSVGSKVPAHFLEPWLLHTVHQPLLFQPLFTFDLKGQPGFEAAVKRLRPDCECYTFDPEPSYKAVVESTGAHYQAWGIGPLHPDVKATKNVWRDTSGLGPNIHTLGQACSLCSPLWQCNQ